MSERKVINKYYPPDFDHTKLPRCKKPKNAQVTVRMMMPMSVRCNTCGEYVYKGKKFNAKKETVLGEEYLGVKIFRFYIRCPKCSSEFTIKTDPKESDYEAELNCSRNFELWREREKTIEKVKRERAEEEEGDAMKALENRTNDSKIEMDILDALAEIKELNARNAKIDPATLLEQRKKEQEDMMQKLDQEDEEELSSVVFKNSENFVKRIEDTEEDNINGDSTNHKRKLQDTDLPSDSPSISSSISISASSTSAPALGTSSLTASNGNTTKTNGKGKITLKPQIKVVAKKKTDTVSKTLSSTPATAPPALSLVDY